MTHKPIRQGHVVNGPYVSGRYKWGVSNGDNTRSRTQAQMDAEFAQVAALGCGWLRHDLRFSVVRGGAADPGSYTWTQYDLLIQRAWNAGLRVCLMLWFFPQWVNGTTDTANLPTDLGAGGSARFSQFVTDVVNRYKRGNANLTGGAHVSHFEIGNEINNASWFKDQANGNGPNVVKYGQLLSGAYDAAKAADPYCTIITAGGVNTGPYQSPYISDIPGAGGSIHRVYFLERLYALGYKNKFDAVGWHPTTAPDPGIMPYRKADGSRQASSAYGWAQMFSDSFGGTRKNARAVMEDNGDAHKPIWATEFAGYGIQAAAAAADQYVDGFTAQGATGVRQDVNITANLIGDMIEREVETWAALDWTGPAMIYTHAGYGPDVALSLVDGTMAPRDRWYRYQYAVKKASSR